MTSARGVPRQRHRKQPALQAKCPSTDSGRGQLSPATLAAAQVVGEAGRSRSRPSSSTWSRFGGRTTSGRVPEGGSGSTRRVESGTMSRPTTGAAEALDTHLAAGGIEDGREALFQSRGPGGEEADGAAVDAAGGAGHDQASGGGSGATGVNVLSHVQGDGDHWRICRTGGPLSTPSRSPATRRRRRRSPTTARRTG